MTPETRSSKSKKNRPSPLIIIGGIVILLAVGFYFISRFMINHPDPEARRVLAEQAEQRSGENTTDSDQPSRTVREMREDATLTFVGPDGSAKTAISIEIADNESSRTQGLMGREHMSEMQGMLFIFPDEDYRSFWMANTPLPLDIIYVNKDRSIVTIQRNTVPYSEESIPSTAPATYVIEVNAGFADRHGLVEGNTVQWLRK